ncbi:MAG TPA: hypothetical protein VF463_16460 [Sphingobium sp.]
MSASPRLDYALLAAPDQRAGQWLEFRPRPTVLKISAMLRGLLWNAEWNETLFLVSLAERMMRVSTAETEAHSERELLLRVARHLDRHAACDRSAYLQIRLRFVSRAGPSEQISEQIAYLSSPRRIAELMTP